MVTAMAMATATATEKRNLTTDMIIAVDFDGTIVEHKYPAIGKEIPFATDVLSALADEGHKIILWTVREGKLLEEAVEFCRARGLEFYAVNSDTPDGSMFRQGPDSRKVCADVYIDDCNIGGIPDWGEIYRMLSGRSGHPARRRRRSFWKRLFGRHHRRRR